MSTALRSLAKGRYDPKVVSRFNLYGEMEKTFCFRVFSFVW